MAGLKLKAVIFGAAVDFLGSIVIGIVAYAATSGGQPITDPVNMQDRFGTFGLALMSVVGLAQTGLGGFAAAQMAQIHHVRHGVAVGVISLILGLLLNATPGPDNGLPMWYQIAAFVGVIPAAAFGGQLAEHRHS